ncbi:hypothetical protein OAF42_01220 [Planctomicrobium sp.]|nr:hypothetical protein [Planctomicrobium sp.]MDB4733040.1 hypothetical protein [Planctomicrobium sp.]
MTSMLSRQIAHIANDAMPVKFCGQPDVRRISTESLRSRLTTAMLLRRHKSLLLDDKGNQR